MAPDRIIISKLLNHGDVEANEQKLLDFEKIYEAEFPDDDEREPLETILNRVKGMRSVTDPRTFILICDNGQLDKVIGGVVGDYYLKSRCIHLTYIFIDSGYRNIGAWTAIKKSVGDTIDLLETLHQVEFDYIFFEANMPEKTVIDSFDPLSRLKIFSRLNAYLVDLPYFQPALCKKSREVSNLYLLCIPRNEKDPSCIDRNVVFDFLFELYKSLNIGNPLNDNSFKHMLGYVDKTADPQKIPLLKISKVINDRAVLRRPFCTGAQCNGSRLDTPR